jgi:hypothetical protein
MLTKKNRVWAMAAVVVAMAGLSACLKNPVQGPPPRPQAGYMFYNASSSTNPLDLFADGEKLNPSKVTTLGFQAYFTGVGGMHEFSFKKAGADSVVAKVSQQYDSLNYYTTIVYGENPLKAVSVISSGLTDLSQDKVNFRFYHLSPNAGPVDLYIDNVKIDSNKTYMGDMAAAGGLRTSFSSISINTASSLIVKAAGTNDILVKTDRSNYNLEILQGRVYTFVLAGLKDNIDTRKLSINHTYGAF